MFAAAIGIPAALFPIAPTVTLFGVALGALMLSGTITGLVMSVALTVVGVIVSVVGLFGFWKAMRHIPIR